MTDLFGGFPEPTSQSDSDVQVLDTTLRDGEQAPSVSLSPDQKVDIARMLNRAGVPIIEAGSACTGAGEREAISRVAEESLDAQVTGFCRGLERDIDLAIDCDVDGVNLVVPASDRHIEGKLGTTRGGIIETTASLVEYACDHGLWVEVLGEDGSRADLDFLARLMESAFDAGADRVCYCDTVGCATPERTADVVSTLAALGPTSAHTHDDLGMGLTNALAAVDAGADIVHTTVNGIGERAGNVALEEVALALAEGYGVSTVDTTLLYALAKTVADTTGISLAPNKAVVGENAFTHESGIHTDGQLKDDTMYEPYSPERVGRDRRFALGKHAGRAGVEAALAEHDVTVGNEELATITEHITDLGADKHVTDADILAFAEEVTGCDR